MNDKHKQAFRELRQWCEKWDISLNTLIPGDYLTFTLKEKSKIPKQDFCYVMYKSFGFGKFDQQIEAYSVKLNFTEQEDDNTKK